MSESRQEESGDELMKTAGREKYWKELDHEKKIERMRDIIKNLENKVQAFGEMVKKLNGHIHSDNQMFFREQPYGGAGAQFRRKPNDDEVWF